MSRAVSIAVLARGINRQKVTRLLYPLFQPGNANVRESYGDIYESQSTFQSSEMDTRAFDKYQTGGHISGPEKVHILVKILLDAQDCKETIYGSLDAWVAFEEKFPIGPLKRVLYSLQKRKQWHRAIQVIKWILSKGQGNTMETYGELIYALDMDHRAKEAHEIWMRKIGPNPHSPSRKLCTLMISVYHRNNMLEDLVKLFKGLEKIDRYPFEKSVVEKVANAYEMLGLLDEKEGVMQKYKFVLNERPKERVIEKDLFIETPREVFNKSKKSRSRRI